jgi:hypothetical protein
MLIKNSLILNEQFAEAFSSLMTLKMPAKQCLEISSCIEDISAQHSILVRAKRAIVDKYCKKEEDGKPSQDEKGNLLFDSPEIFKTCTEELKEIEEEEIDLALSNKVKVSKDEIMTPIQVTLLKDFIEIEE